MFISEMQILIHVRKQYSLLHKNKREITYDHLNRCIQSTSWNLTLLMIKCLCKAGMKKNVLNINK